MTTFAGTAAIRSGYDRWALVYDHDANPLPALEEPILRDLLGPVAGLSVLDLGCGTGRHAVRLAAAGAEVTAADFSEGMLAEARRKAGAEVVRFLVHDLHDPLPLPEGSFDRVVSGLVLEHLGDLGGFFREARRMLRPGGRAVISAMHPAMFLRGSQARFTDPDSGRIVQPGSLPHSFGDVIMAAVRAGFRIDHIGEHAPDAAFAARYPRAEKYVGYPMLVVLGLAAGGIAWDTGPGASGRESNGTAAAERRTDDLCEASCRAISRNPTGRSSANSTRSRSGDSAGSSSMRFNR